MMHPAGLLLTCAAVIFVLQGLAGFPLMLLSALISMVAIAFSVRLYRVMLRRARWLFLAMVVMFGTMTPGLLLPYPWSFGMVTMDGAAAAAEHVLRLAAMLGVLALVLGRLDQTDIAIGLHSLLRPLTAIGVDRERIVVRLLLTLDCTAGDSRYWREFLRCPIPSLPNDELVLPARAWSIRDAIPIFCASVLAVAAWLPA